MVDGALRFEGLDGLALSWLQHYAAAMAVA